MPDSQSNPSTVVLVTRNGMGHADQELQHKLITTYFKLLDDSDTLPAIICFYAEGVKLVTTGSPVIGTLKALEAKGVHLVICNTCLNFYGLQEQVELGIVGGMTDIIEAQWRADKVITL
jgi:intracellular sulfur oxidation DsrE/DsrF family protein